MKIIQITTITLFFLFTNLSYADASDKPVYERLLHLLKQQDYKQLDAELQSYQMAYEDNMVEEEDNLYMAFYAFNTSDESLEKYFNEWVETAPKSYAAYLARGIYFKNIGWKYQGSGYFSDISEKRAHNAHLYFEKALDDIQKSLQLNPKGILSYIYAMDLLRIFSRKEDMDRLVEQALEKNPNSLLARWFYLLYISPIWGGSVEAMEQFINEAKPYYKSNPKLNILEGRILAQQGDQLMHAGKNRKAIAYYNKALKFGSHYYYNRQRGYAYYNLGEYKLARDDFRQSLQQRPLSIRTLQFYSQSEYMTWNFPKACFVLKKVLELNPDYERAKQFQKQLDDARRCKR